jgi:hypothetical protein
MVEPQYDAACCGSTASLQFHTLYFILYTLYFLLPTSYFLLPTSYFVSPCVAWWRRSTTQRAAARLRLYNFILYTLYFILPTSYFLLRITMRCMVETQYDAACCGSTASLQFPTLYFILPTSYFLLPTSYHHALHGGDAVRRSVLRLDCVATISYFLLRITMRCMVEPQYDAACCGSTASLQFPTSYFVSPCVAWWRRSTTQRAAARLRLYNFILYTLYFILLTSYHHALHGGDAVRRSVLRLDCVSTISYFILYTLYFILPTSYFLLRITMRCMVETQYDAACCGSTASLQFHTLYFILPTSYFLLPTSYHHALHGGAAVRRSVLRLDCVSTISYFLFPTSSVCAARANDNPRYMIIVTVLFVLVLQNPC